MEFLLSRTWFNFCLDGRAYSWSVPVNLWHLALDNPNCKWFSQCLNFRFSQCLNYLFPEQYWLLLYSNPSYRPSNMNKTSYICRTNVESYISDNLHRYISLLKILCNPVTLINLLEFVGRYSFLAVKKNACLNKLIPVPFVSQFTHLVVACLEYFISTAPKTHIPKKDDKHLYTYYAHYLHFFSTFLFNSE